jgi:hypothetical protein
MVSGLAVGEGLYARLLAEVQALADAIPQPGGTCDALGAVLSLHEPQQYFTDDRDGRHGSYIWCRTCTSPAAIYPCETVRAIARALDVPIEGDQQ